MFDLTNCIYFEEWGFFNETEGYYEWIRHNFTGEIRERAGEKGWIFFLPP